MKSRLGDRVRVQHILKAVEEIETFLEDADYDKFEHSSLIQSAVIRQLDDPPIFRGDTPPHLANCDNRYSRT